MAIRFPSKFKILVRPFRFFVKILKKFIRSVFRILFLPLWIVWMVLRFPFRLRKTGRERFILAVIFIAALGAGIIDWEKSWNTSADFLNPKIDQAFGVRGEKINLGQLNIPFLLGLDLQGGTQLVYEADLSGTDAEDISQTMQGLRDILERRVNALGVREPVVQIEETPGHHRILVELAGIKDIKAAVAAVGETPSLDFREESEEQLDQLVAQLSQQPDITEEQKTQLRVQLMAAGAGFVPADPPLTGRYLKRANIDFNQTTGEALVALEFNSEGADIFKELTRKNVGKPLAIYINQDLISAPTVQQEIAGGRAVITGNFSVDEAKKLARNLNAGALDAPITLVFQETIGPSLGQDSLKKIIEAGLIGFAFVTIFMIVWYRLPGLIAVCALGIYTALLLALFKIIPVTMTLPGVAGFILSIGMAVDANILIFSRMREERRWGRPFAGSVTEGFSRAWTSIRDSNISTLITTAILFLVGTSFIKGFALTLGIGVLLSMFTAVFVSRLLLKLFVGTRLEKLRWLW